MTLFSKKFKLETINGRYYVELPKTADLETSLEFVEYLNELPKEAQRLHDELEKIENKMRKDKEKHEKRMKEINEHLEVNRAMSIRNEQERNRELDKILIRNLKKPLWKKLCDPFYERIINKWWKKR